MNRGIFVATILLFLLQFSFAQNQQNLKGEIMVLNDTVAVPYAHVSILGTSKGTVSNINGYFELKGKFNRNTDTLVVSNIEYQKKQIPLSILVADTNRIYLKKNKYLLAEAIVLPESTKKEIFRNVIQNIKKNYADKLYQSEAFYREVQYEKNSEKYTRLIEVAINIQDGKITAPLSKIKCSILQFRKSDNFTREDNEQAKSLKKLLELQDNRLQILLTQNPIRYYKSRLKTSKFNPINEAYKNDNPKYNLLLERVIKKENSDIYVFQIGSFSLYINKKDYAILRIDQNLYDIVHSTYRYKKIGEKYFPVFFSCKNVSNWFKKKKGLGYTQNSLTFVNYSTNKKHFKRLRSKYTLPKEIDLYKQKVVYDEKFWNNYNILIDEPLSSKVIFDLGKKKSLQKQFEENAK